MERRPAIDRMERDLYLREMPARKGFIPSLNGVRAISILIVFLSHTVNDKLFPGGFGVRIFFVISGFLITRLLFVELKTTGRIHLPQFYIRRLLRLYPVIFAFIAVVMLASLVWRPLQVNAVEPLSALFYFANYYYAYLSEIGHPGGTMPFAIFWSLSVEEHFYILFPFVFVALSRQPRLLVAFCAAIFALCLMLRVAVAYRHPELLETYVFYYETQYQMDAIGYGVLMAVLCELPLGRDALRVAGHPAMVLAALVVILVCFGYRDLFFRETVRYSLLSASLVVVLTNVLFSPTLVAIKAVLNTPILDFIGRLSYSIYIWHYGVINLISTADQPQWLRLLIFTLSTAALSLASYYLVEQPISALRHRRFSAPRRVVVSPP